MAEPAAHVAPATRPCDERRHPTLNIGGCPCPARPSCRACARCAARSPVLRRPPAPAAVRFKPLTDLGDSCQLAAYTDVRFVIDLLNAVCARHWHADYDPLPDALRGTPRGPDDPRCSTCAAR